jgi:hypothetical protein
MKKQFSYRIAGGLALAVLVLYWLLAAGCVRRIDGTTGTIEADGFVLKEVEIENARFEPQGLPFAIQPARAYWLRRGDVMAPKWDTFEWHWERKGQMCDFPGNVNTPGGDCQVCNFCNLPSSLAGEPCFGIHPLFADGVLDVVADAGFISTETPMRIVSYAGNSAAVSETCANNPRSPALPFTPAVSGVYRYANNPINRFVIKGDTDGEIKLHVVESGPGLAQRTYHALKRETVDGTNYWTWVVGGSPLWLENFSPNLRVTDIRVLRGKCADGSAQGQECAVPNESVPVKPSRLLFLPDFQGTVSGYPGESQHRCYSNPTATGGNFINLDACRTTYSPNALPTVPKFALPTYESDPARPLERMTWLIEFNTNESADADVSTPANDPMPADAELIIEFTVQAN